MSQPTVLVTGGGRGIGRAVCVRFAQAGYDVAAVARSPKELAETQSEVEKGGGLCTRHCRDLREPKDIEGLFREVLGQRRRIDVLVNSAGVAPLAPIEQLTPAVFDDLLAVNVRAIYETCRRVWAIMKDQGGGVIVNISSIASRDPFPGFAAYGASKAWVNHWTKGLAEEGRPHGIRVFSVAPGAVETKMLRDVFPTFPADQALQPSDVADVVHALTLPACRFATGETVFVRRQGEPEVDKGTAR